MNVSSEKKTRDKIKELFPSKQVNRLVSFRRLPTKKEQADPFTTHRPTCPLSYFERLV